MKHSLVWINLCLLMAFSCNEDYEVAYVEYQPKVVVEGWIENGTTPVVLLSRSASFTHELDTAYLLDQIIRSAKVSVSDGEETEILTLSVNSNYLPPYAYQGRQIRGKTGKTYRLQIEYRGEILSAETYIPEPVSLESCRFVPDSSGDNSTGHIQIQFKNTSTEYYQVATRVLSTETVFTPCLYGNLPSTLFEKDKLVSIQINKGPVFYPDLQLETSYMAGDWIDVKFRTQSRVAYDFWNSWQNEVLNAQNPVFPAYTNLKSNIKGGIGIWCGYGVSNYRIHAN